MSIQTPLRLKLIGDATDEFPPRVSAQPYARVLALVGCGEAFMIVPLRGIAGEPESDDARPFAQRPVERPASPIWIDDPLVGSLDVAQDVAERLGWRFARLWAASTTSALGSGLATIATPLLVASRTSNPLIVSAAFAVAWLPWLLFALPGGVLVDRVDRRRLMILIDWVRVAAMSVLAMAILTGHTSIALLYAVLFVVNMGEIVFRSASQAMIPSIVPRARLERANGWLVGGTTLMQGMIARPLGGFLFVVAASIPFLPTRARTRQAPSSWPGSRGPIDHRRPQRRALMAENAGVRVRSGWRLSKGSVGWRTSGCSVRWRS